MTAGMKLADGIRKHGFRKWYERELLQSHAHLVLTFLCMIGIFAGFEALGAHRGWFDQAQNIAVIGLCVAIGIWAVRRYLYFLGHAEATANQADCPQCQAYGRGREREGADAAGVLPQVPASLDDQRLSFRRPAIRRPRSRSAARCCRAARTPRGRASAG
jgi:hypothetical protein